MRLWSLHPRYLDQKGLVALWREGLLAQHVLSGKTKGYTKHPQLIRFQAHDDPVQAITHYLHNVVDEADSRGYHFDREKLLPRTDVRKIWVTSGQIKYEKQHLKEKLSQRAPNQLLKLESLTHPEPNPLFIVVSGPVENWEKTL